MKLTQSNHAFGVLVLRSLSAAPLNDSSPAIRRKVEGSMFLNAKDSSTAEDSEHNSKLLSRKKAN
jgi:hypothetical protein